MRELNDIEKDLIEFLSWKNGVDAEKTAGVYERLRRRFRFQSVSFRDLTENVQELHELFFGKNEEDLVRAYRHHSYLAVLRFISYSFPRRADWPANAFYFLRLILRGRGSRAFCSLKRQWEKRFQRRRKADFPSYVRDHYKSPVIVDYGCGLAFGSFSLGKEIPGSHIVLVDVDSVMSEFVEFRFRKHGISSEAVKVTPDRPYPELPRHQVCIADEVMEHLRDPLRALDNIRRSLQLGGVLFGDYGDHCPEHFHIHTDMAFFRRDLNRGFVRIADRMHLRIDESAGLSPGRDSPG